jgi:hypothetical protein
MGSMQEMIGKRAYELFLKRGGAHGYHMADWFQAEKEISAEIAAKKKTEIKQPAVTAAPATPPKASATMKTYPGSWKKAR